MNNLEAAGFGRPCVHFYNGRIYSAAYLLRNKILNIEDTTEYRFRPFAPPPLPLPFRWSRRPLDEIAADRDAPVCCVQIPPADPGEESRVIYLSIRGAIREAHAAEMDYQAILDATAAPKNP